MLYNHLWFLHGAILSVHSEAFMSSYGTCVHWWYQKKTSLLLEIIIMIMKLFNFKHRILSSKTKQNWISGTSSPSTSPESAHPIYLQLIWFKDTLISATRQESNKINQRAWINVKSCEVKVQLCFREELVLKQRRAPQLSTSFIWTCRQEILSRKLDSKHYHSVSQLTALPPNLEKQTFPKSRSHSWT